MSDMVNHPEHYADTTSIECIEAMEIAFGTEAVIDFCRCNAFKYLWRHKNKNGIEDLDKALWYTQRVFEMTDKWPKTVQDEILVKMIRRYKKK